MLVGPVREGSAGSAARPWLLLGAALVAVVVAYSPVLTAVSTPPGSPPGVAMAPPEDAGQGLPDPTPAGPGADVRIPERGAFRPLTDLSLELDPDGRSGRRDGRPVNVALHLLNTALLFLLLRRGDRAGAVALSLALGWALLPRLTEAVAWPGGRADLLATAAVLTALILLRSDRVARQTAGAGALLLGLLAKEVALAGWVAAACLALRRAPRGGRRLFGATAPLAVALAAYAALRVFAGATTLPEEGPSSVGARLGVSLEALGTYAWMALDPLHPAARIGLVAAPSPPMRGFGALVAAGALVTGWAFRRRARLLDERAVFGWPLLAVALGLVLHLVPLAQDVVAADRLLYLPLAALAAVLAPALERLTTRRPWARWLAAPALLALGAVTALRVNTWSDPERFWVVTTRGTRPADPVPTLALSSVLLDAGLADLAQPLVDAALIAEPAPYSHRAVLFERAAACRRAQGDYDGARWLLEQILPLRPQDPSPWVGLVRLEVTRLDLDAAWARHAAFVARFPRDPRGPRLLAELQAAPELLDRIRHPIAVVDPDRARAFARVGRTGDAVAEWRRILAALTLPDPILYEAMAYVIRVAPPEIALEARLDFLRHRINEPDPELDARLIARRDRVRRLRRLMAP